MAMLKNLFPFEKNYKKNITLFFYQKFGFIYKIKQKKVYYYKEFD